MNAFWSALALVTGLGIIARLVIINATRKEESLAEQRLRRRLAEELGTSDTDLIEPSKGLFGRGRRRRPKGEKSPTVTGLAHRLEGVTFFQEDEGQSFLEKLQQELTLAGLEQRWTPFEALALAIIIWAFGVAGTTALYLLAVIPKLLYIPAVVIALIYPFTKLRSLKRNRQDSIRAENIIFIMQLRMAISSGMTTIDEALARIARQAEIDPYDSILASEFGRAVNRIRVGGVDWDVAVRDVSARTGVLSVENLVEALIQGRRMGSDLTRTLEEYGRSASELWQQDMRALKAKKEPMITVGMIITLFGGFLLIAGPMMLSLLKTMSIVGGG